MLCYNCMRDKGDNRFCPHCGAENIIDQATHHLPPGTVIGNRYTLGRVLGEGGFGITYIGFDHVLDTLIAVKEYFPYGFSHRVNTVSNTVTVSAGNNDDFFEKGKRRFLSEAKNVARFRNEPGIVIVTDFIEENNTAYIIMEYLDGIDLRNYLRQYGTMSVDQALDLLLPVIKSLNKMHEAGIIHRDISPDNLMYLKDGSVKLMDFGAARDYVGDNRSMSVMLKKGYAPEEQYRSNGKQGPWTDVYGMCATFYRCITGRTPDESLDRIFEDPLKRPSELGVNITPAVENVLMYGLAVRKEDRCPNMAELRRLLLKARSAPSQEPATTALSDEPKTTLLPSDAQNRSEQNPEAHKSPVNRPDVAVARPVHVATPVQQQRQPQQQYNNNNARSVSQRPVTLQPANRRPAPGSPHPGVPAYPSGQQQTPKSSKKVPIIVGSVAGALVLLIVILVIVNPFKNNGGGTVSSVVSTASSSGISSSSTSSATSSSTSSAASSEASSVVSNSSSRITSGSFGGEDKSTIAASLFTVQESGTEAQTFQKTVDYAMSRLSLADYQFNINGTAKYPLSATGCYATNTDKDFYTTDLKHTGDATYDCSTEVTIGGKEYDIGTTTLQDMLDDGWVYGEDKPEANKTLSQGIDLILNNKSLRAYVSNTGNDANAAKVRSYFLYAEREGYTDFDFLSITPNDTMDTVLTKLKAPSEVHMYAGKYTGTIEFSYDTTDSNIAFNIYFKYSASSDSTSLDHVYLAYFD